MYLERQIDRVSKRAIDNDRDAVRFAPFVHIRSGDRVVNDRGIREELVPVLEQEVERWSRRSNEHVNSVVRIFLAQVIAHQQRLAFSGEAAALQVFGVVFDGAGGRRSESRLN